MHLKVRGVRGTIDIKLTGKSPDEFVKGEGRAEKGDDVCKKCVAENGDQNAVNGVTNSADIN